MIFFAEADWIDKDPIELFGQTDGQELIDRDQEVIQKRTIKRERPFFDKLGNIRVFDGYYFVIDGVNDLPLIGGVALEITDKINAHNALTKSEERYRTIFESAISSIGILSTEGIIVEANANVVELTGYSREEILGKMAWTSFVYPEDLKMVAEQRKSRLASSSSDHQEYEFRLLRKDKTIRHIRMRTGTISGSDGVGVISLSDVTNTVNYQKQLKQALTKTEAILEAIPDLMLVLSGDGKYLDFHASNQSTSFLEAYAIDQNNFSGIEFPVINREELISVIQLTLQTDSVQNFEYSLQLPDGIHYYDACLSSFERDSVLVLCRDVTQRKVVEEEQLQLQAQMRHVQKLESLGVLAGGIAHDFNNILMAISGNTQLAQSMYKTGGDISKHLNAIDLATARASDLATQMLDYSGRADSKMAPVNLNIVVNEISDILGITVTRRAKLTMNLDSAIPMILGDDSQIRQVFMNLITNASESFENKRGKITVQTGIKYLKKEYIDSFSSLNKLPAGNYVFIEVTDNGSGIGDDIKDKIFDPFFTTKFTGRGLGLSAVIGIMSNHSGVLQLDSTLGKGSTFRAYFPVSIGETCQIAESNELSIENQNLVGSVLCVDDEPLVREVLSTMLEQLGFDVILAVDGIDCIRKFMQHSDTIDLILLDVTMPNMNGDEAFYEIRKLKQDIPVIISSGYAEAEIVTRFPSKYPDGFLQKPYSANELKRIVKSLLDL